MRLTHVIRWGSLMALAALLVLGPVLPVLGQGGDEINCAGLSDADCQILRDATAAMPAFTSLNIPAWSFSMSAAAAGEDVLIAGSGSAAIIAPPELIAMISDLPLAGHPTDLAPMIALLDQIDALFIERMITGLVVHVRMDTLLVNTPDEQLAIDLEMILKDKRLYLSTSSPNGARPWFGQALDISAADLAELDANLDDLRAVFQDPEFLQAMAAMSELNSVMDRLNALINQFVTTTRGPDQMLHGQNMVAFTTTVDLLGLLQSPDLATLLAQMVAHPAFQQLMQEEGLGQVNATQIQFALMTIGFLFGGSSISVDQWIGADDGYPHKVQADINLVLDASLFDATVGKIVFNISAGVEMDQFGTLTPDDIPTPTGWLPLDESNDFLPGSPSMIEATIAVGQPYQGTVGATNDQAVLALPLDEGYRVIISVESDDYPYVKLYGPDGFLIERIDSYYDKELITTTSVNGTHLVVVEAYWETDYWLIAQGQ